MARRELWCLALVRVHPRGPRGAWEERISEVERNRNSRPQKLGGLVGSSSLSPSKKLPASKLSWAQLRVDGPQADPSKLQQGAKEGRSWCFLGF